MKTTPPLSLTIEAPSKPPIHLMLRGRMASAVRAYATAAGVTPGEAARRLIVEGYKIVTGRDLGGRK